MSSPKVFRATSYGIHPLKSSCGVELINDAFMSASRGIAVINVGSLDNGNTSFKRIKITGPHHLWM